MFFVPNFGKRITCRLFLIATASMLLTALASGCSPKEEAVRSPTALSVAQNAPDSPVRAVNPRMADKATFGAKPNAVKRRER